MNLLIAPGSFKNALSAKEVANAIGRGIRKSIPEAEIRIIPMADGGEGTVESLIDATGGKRVGVSVHDPMFSIIDAPMTMEEAMKKTRLLLENTGENIGRLLKLGIGYACHPPALE